MKVRHKVAALLLGIIAVGGATSANAAGVEGGGSVADGNLNGAMIPTSAGNEASLSGCASGGDSALRDVVARTLTCDLVFDPYGYLDYGTEVTVTRSDIEKALGISVSTLQEWCRYDGQGYNTDSWAFEPSDDLSYSAITSSTEVAETKVTFVSIQCSSDATGPSYYSGETPGDPYFSPFNGQGSFIGEFGGEEPEHTRYDLPREGRYMNTPGRVDEYCASVGDPVIHSGTPSAEVDRNEFWFPVVNWAVAVSPGGTYSVDVASGPCAAVWDLTGQLDASTPSTGVTVNASIITFDADSFIGSAPGAISREFPFVVRTRDGDGLMARVIAYFAAPLEPETVVTPEPTPSPEPTPKPTPEQPIASPEPPSTPKPEVPEVITEPTPKPKPVVTPAPPATPQPEVTPDPKPEVPESSEPVPTDEPPLPPVTIGDPGPTEEPQPIRDEPELEPAPRDEPEVKDPEPIEPAPPSPEVTGEPAPKAEPAPRSVPESVQTGVGPENADHSGSSPTGFVSLGLSLFLAAAALRLRRRSS